MALATVSNCFFISSQPHNLVMLLLPFTSVVAIINGYFKERFLCRFNYQSRLSKRNWDVNIRVVRNAVWFGLDSHRHDDGWG